MKYIGIDWGNPLILLRVYLGAIWVLPALYGLRTLWKLPRESPFRPLVFLSVIASLTGAASYLVGASTEFTSPVHFIWVAGLLAFTPLALLAWFYVARQREDKTKRL